jgi:putative chitinase
MILTPKLITALPKLFPSSQVAKYIPFLEEVFEFADIDTPLRAAMFLGQIGVECDMFTTFSENLHYTSATRLTEVWPSRFRLPRVSDLKEADVFKDGMRNATRFLRNPQKLANYVYASRNGNRDEASGDGYRFRGRGPKQITGAYNYVELTKDMQSILKTDFIKRPDDLLIPRNGLYAAGWFWKDKKLNRYADLNDNTHVTRIVNGGTLKLKERGQLKDKILTTLKAA